jgi:hypothetical protein
LGLRKPWFLKRLAALKRSPRTLPCNSGVDQSLFTADSRVWKSKHIWKTPLRREHLQVALLTQSLYSNYFPRICFTVLNRPASQRLLPLWSKGAWQLLEQAVGLGIIHIMLVCRHAECKSCGMVESFTQLSVESLGSQAMCDRVRVPAGRPLRDDV